MKKDIFDKFSMLITGAFGFVAALSWNSAIQGFLQSKPYLVKFGPWVYAVFVTILAVFVTLWFARISKRLDK